jgi:DEAD/DEAH box helicase
LNLDSPYKVMFLLGVAQSILFFHLLMSSGNNSGGNRTTLQKSVSVPGGPTTMNTATTKRTKKEAANKPNSRSTDGSKTAGPRVAAGVSSSVVKPTGQARKLGKRALQLAAMAKKAETEDAYFRQCQRDARRQKSQGQMQPNVTKARETELFGTQTVQGINFAKYDDIQVEVKLPGSNQKDQTIVAMKHFEDLASTLDATLKQNIQRMRYTTPTPIQRHAIPQAMAGEDLLCCAQTGSGKTCAFLLPICAALAKGVVDNTSASSSATTPCSPRCIVLAPTRELASQIELEAQKLTYGMSNVRPVAVYGGANQRQQLRDLAFGADIVVATPGRLTDFVERKIVSLANVQYLILDEADRMLDMGFEVRLLWVWVCL